MTVYELIQELAKQNCDDDVLVEVNGVSTPEMILDSVYCGKHEIVLRVDVELGEAGEGGG